MAMTPGKWFWWGDALFTVVDIHLIAGTRPTRIEAESTHFAVRVPPGGAEVFRIESRVFPIGTAAAERARPQGNHRAIGSHGVGTPLALKRDMDWMTWTFAVLSASFVLAATGPVVTGLYQYALLPFSLFHANLERTESRFPNVSILIPAWNEDAVVETTIRNLLALDYPTERLRIFIIDDASTDQTPSISIRLHKIYPKNVFHIRRVAGGEGKAHTLNYGLNVLWANDWTEAVLIMDADVIYTPTSLARMARHLADPTVGAVTAYIKEGSRAPNYVQRFVTFEYITATGASRRAQNVMGFLACLSGGAQLHSRENLMAIGGQIFSATLAEDTFTTFNTQLGGRRAIFEPNAIVYAEEPDSLTGLWKQRVRWARGNVQISSVFRNIWFRGGKHGGLGSNSMGMIWFSIFLMPIFQIGAAVSLIALYFLDAPLAWVIFRTMWITAAIVYLVVTFASYCVDPESSAKSWLQGILFPGVVSLTLIVHALVPGLIPLILGLCGLTLPEQPPTWWMLFLYSWLAVSMAVAYAAKWVEGNERLAWLAPWLLHIGGYGPFLCAVTFGSYIKELMGEELKWDKTVKTGKVG